MRRIPRIRSTRETKKANLPHIIYGQVGRVHHYDGGDKCGEQPDSAPEIGRVRLKYAVFRAIQKGDYERYGAGENNQIEGTAAHGCKCEGGIIKQTCFQEHGSSPYDYDVIEYKEVQEEQFPCVRADAEKVYGDTDGCKQIFGLSGIGATESPESI